MQSRPEMEPARIILAVMGCCPQTMMNEISSYFIGMWGFSPAGCAMPGEGSFTPDPEDQAAWGE